MSEQQRQTVLVVDDDEAGRELVVRKLARDYEVRTADDGHAALAAVRRGGVDLVVMDVMMPGLDGFESCRLMKSESSEEFLPVILLTALHGQDDINQGLAAGADEFLTKPADTHELRLRASGLLRVRAQDAAIRRQSERLEELVRERTADLRRQHELIQQIVDSLPVSLYVVDRERKVVAWNRRRELGQLGVPREEALGKSLFELFHRMPPQEIDRELSEVFGSGEPSQIETESNGTGARRYYRIQRVPMFLGSDRVTHVMTIGEDITDRRRIQESLALTDKMVAVGRLAAGVAHEINNPLATIVTCAGALQGRMVDSVADGDERAEVEEYLEIMQQEAFRAKRISEGLLDFSRTQPSERISQRLEQVVERTLLVLKHHAGFKRVEISRAIEEGLPPVRVEQDALVQVLVALIINALDAMPDGGTLELNARSDGHYVCCDVRDTGCGIPPADLADVFEPFFTTKPPGEGTGLGLAVCYGIMNAHGGRIEVESVVGKGSCFTVVLPADDSDMIEEAV